MNERLWLIFAGMLAGYIGLVMLFGFEGPIAWTIAFGRLTVWIAFLILYLPALEIIFNEVPAPRRDYLVLGLILNGLSGDGFSVLNALGRTFRMDTSIWTSPTAGFFSLLLLGSGVACVVAPTLKIGGTTRKESLLYGAIFAIAILVVLPMIGTTWPCSPALNHWLDSLKLSCAVVQK